jgi:hypothetical protein
MISQRASRNTNWKALNTAHASSRPKTTVKTALYQVLKRFSLAHSEGESRRSGGRSGSGIGMGSSVSTRVAISGPPGDIAALLASEKRYAYASKDHRRARV